jgi:transposase
LLGQGRYGIFSRWAQKQEPCQSIFLTHSTLNLYVKAHQKMTQRSIVAYPSLKGMSAREIHDNVVAILGPDAVSYSSVTRYLREARFHPSKPDLHPADVQRDLGDSD